MTIRPVNFVSASSSFIVASTASDDPLSGPSNTICREHLGAKHRTTRVKRIHWMNAIADRRV